MGSKDKWMRGAVKHPGGLHRALGIAEDKKIPASKINAAKNSDNPKVRKMATLAKTFSKFRGGKR